MIQIAEGDQGIVLISSGKRRPHEQATGRQNPGSQADDPLFALIFHKYILLVVLLSIYVGPVPLGAGPLPSHQGLRVQAKADGNGRIHLVHDLLIQPAHFLPQTPLIQRAHLL